MNRDFPKLIAEQFVCIEDSGGLIDLVSSTYSVLIIDAETVSSQGRFSRIITAQLRISCPQTKGIYNTQLPMHCSGLALLMTLTQANISCRISTRCLRTWKFRELTVVTSLAVKRTSVSRIDVKRRFALRCVLEHVELWWCKLSF
jgi:hypothetical protein